MDNAYEAINVYLKVTHSYPFIADTWKWMKAHISKPAAIKRFLGNM